MKTIPYEHKAYLTYMNYFATGEGMTHEINHCWADNTQEAIEKHLTEFGYKTKSSRDYYSTDVEVMLASSQKAKKLLMQFFKDGKRMFQIMQDAAFELHVKLYWNFS